jgi:nitroreductase
MSFAQDLNTVIRYHEQTKHYPDRYANGPGYMDWNCQPDPFRTYDGAPQILLPLSCKDTTPPYENLFLSDDNSLARPLDMFHLGIFLEHAMAISAWKQYGEARWALRINPSSGNLHPTESYLILPPIPGIGSTYGLYHYQPGDHMLEHRGRWPELGLTLPPIFFFIALTSVHWRESWKYGERAFRYSQLDGGHALMALHLAGRMMNWQIRIMDRVSDEQLCGLTGINRQEYIPEERESPEVLLAVLTDKNPAAIDFLGAACEAMLKNSLAVTWYGNPNRLSDYHQPWTIIDQVEQATRKPALQTIPDAPELFTGKFTNLTGIQNDLTSGQICKQRRSALGMDGRTEMLREDFFRILCRLYPPMPLFSYLPQIQLLVFVHRVKGFASGLYILVRNHPSLAELKSHSHKDFHWLRVDGLPEQVPFYLLEEGNFQDISRVVACHQDIAADGVFHVAMLSRFDSLLQEQGPWIYRRMFWEAGMIGQLLYLEAEACRFSATGIGCFFDDVLHQVVGLQHRTYQDVYHFTVGKAVPDDRLTTQPAYDITRRNFHLM